MSFLYDLFFIFTLIFKIDHFFLKKNLLIILLFFAHFLEYLKLVLNDNMAKNSE